MLPHASRNIIDALRMKGVIVIGRISGDDIRVMIARYRDKQLRPGYIRVL